MEIGFSRSQKIPLPVMLLNQTPHLLPDEQAGLEMLVQFIWSLVFVSWVQRPWLVG